MHLFEFFITKSSIVPEKVNFCATKQFFFAKCLKFDEITCVSNSESVNPFPHQFQWRWIRVYLCHSLTFTFPRNSLPQAPKYIDILTVDFGFTAWKLVLLFFQIPHPSSFAGHLGESKSLALSPEFHLDYGARIFLPSIPRATFVGSNDY